MNVTLCHLQQPDVVQHSTMQERSQFLNGFVRAFILVVIESGPLFLWLFWLGTGTSLDRLPNFVQMLAIVGSLYCLTALAGIILALLESRQFLGIGMLIGMAAGILISAGYGAGLFLLLALNTCHTLGASCT